ncbi:zerumbone synthase isoform X2 [Mangifera indica]|uniref:zerumbone synthase isoform X2 n=1 Tax=Mangifera indica TaxID=29780 RepID=UPI001CF9D2B4|nr:zerumbone synthase isoform X2 [Mangifera indica]
MSNSNSTDLPVPPRRLEGKVALVTGAATGIGESIARLFCKHGAKVCIVDVQDNLGQLVCDSLGGDPNTFFFHCDVTKEDNVRAAIDSTVDKFGTLDIMVNNAGISGSPCFDIRNADLSEFERVFDVNVKGVFHGMKHAARIMIPQNNGSIISVCSVASVIGGLGPHAYTGSKHAVLGLNKNVAAELGKYRIRVNCVSPYAVATGLAVAHLPEEERTDDAMAAVRDFTGRNANLQGVELMPEDVANAVLFLASDESRYISGANLMVDGGFTTVNHSLRVFR